MPSASRAGDACSGHGPYPGRPSYGGSSNVLINGIPALRTGDGYVPHCSPKKCHGGSAGSGSSSVFVNGRPLIRIGDAVTCGSVSANGSPNVFAGG